MIFMSKMEKTVLSYDKLKKKIQDRPAEKKKALEHLKEMASTLTDTSIDTMRKILDKTLIKLYDGINFEVPADIDLASLVKNNNIIFVLNHQSHADYLLFNYILFTRFKFSSYIAGGINLNIFPIGDLFRRSGCFFIRRSFHNDILYKLTLEAYLSHLLLNEERPIEFFFEGGRSRTGRLMSPKFGLFQMLLETHGHLQEGKRPMLFIPVSIVHELVPEQKALAREALGKSKQKENILQLVKLLKFLSRKFGTVHIKINPAISVPEPVEDIKMATQQLAFECFRSVGKGMMVTPSAILAHVLLDSPTGPLSWEEILTGARPLLDYCERFNVPLPPSLHKEKWEDSIKRVLDIFIEGKKIKKEVKEKLNKSFYVIDDYCRMELLFFKNTSIHHFLVPFFINSALLNIRNGRIKDVHELKNYLLFKRKELMFEFYLPVIKEMFFRGLEIVSFCIGRKVENLQECFHFTPEEARLISRRVGPFSSAFSYIFEGYYIVALTLKHFGEKTFTREEFHKTTRDIFDMEILHGRFVRYVESYTQPVMKTGFAYFLHQKLIIKEEGKFRVPSQVKVEEMIARYAQDLTDLVITGLKVKTYHLNEGQRSQE